MNEGGDQLGDCDGNTDALVLTVAQAIKGERTDLLLGQQTLLGHRRLLYKTQSVQPLLLLPNTSQTT